MGFGSSDGNYKQEHYNSDRVFRITSIQLRVVGL